LRTPEIGLRLALGASPRSVLMMVLGHGTLLTVAGVAIGLVAAFGATRLVTSMLFEITPTDAPRPCRGHAGIVHGGADCVRDSGVARWPGRSDEVAE
jgi:ABC-type antimicrobial peptide transport system permease subunit